MGGKVWGISSWASALPSFCLRLRPASRWWPPLSTQGCPVRPTQESRRRTGKQPGPGRGRRSMPTWL